jgi:hypothetical protein
MRSLRKDVVCKNTEILGLTIRYGKWYKVFIGGGSRGFWLVRFYGVDGGSRGQNQFLHKGTAYVVRPECGVSDYPATSGSYYPLCDVDDITDIEMVNWNYVESIIKQDSWV